MLLDLQETSEFCASAWQAGSLDVRSLDVAQPETKPALNKRPKSHFLNIKTSIEINLISKNQRDESIGFTTQGPIKLMRWVVSWGERG